MMTTLGSGRSLRCTPSLGVISSRPIFAQSKEEPEAEPPVFLNFIIGRGDRNIHS